MTESRFVCASLIGAVLAFSPFSLPGHRSAFLGLGPLEARADAQDRRQIRRTVRRIDRRQDRREARRNALPSDCVKVIVNGYDYWRCGSVYYEEIIEDGVRVYIVVEL